ncbi:carboxylesterase [Frankia sp. CiP3]|uniref:alpha/beta hydrolase n=1 Tax=Frankia sp. CiP3 TaxID=2880971 RepID=UPI001EF4FAA2|nr:alpha/beta fold hydrolase [Frankia sp. CiP3]
MTSELTDDEVGPFTAGETSRGVLLLHGFGGSPASMRPWARYLLGQGYRVSVPLLPGHGTTWQDLSSTRWPDWYGGAERALIELAEHCETVAVTGLSMGGSLALRLAARHPAIVRAVVLVNPSIANPNRLLFALPVLQHLVPSIRNDGPMVKKPDVPRASYDRLSLKAVRSMTLLWRDVRPRLSAVTQPLLLFRSLADGTAGELSSGIVLRGIASAEHREVLLPDSYHIATLDNDAETIFAESAAFLRTWLPVFQGGPDPSDTTR